MASKKHQVLEELFEYCKKRDGENQLSYTFTNEDVKKMSEKIGFGNSFDVTKIDSKEKLPVLLRTEDYGIIHIGKGRHMFVKGIDNLYHSLEPISKEETINQQKSIINNFNTSESNILSVCNNYGILYDFLFGKKDFETESKPKTYCQHRTKTNLTYKIQQQKVKLENIQIEIDLTIEYQGNIFIFEAKNGKPKSFAIYQLYHPFLYYHNAKNEPQNKELIKKIYCIYVVRKNENNCDFLKFWKYSFDQNDEMNSIKLLDCKQYNINWK